MFRGTFDRSFSTMETKNLRKSVLMISALFLCLSLYSQRDPYQWPFSKTSIWNLPIHKAAVYEHARIGAPEGAGLLCDEDYLVLMPHAPLTDVFANNQGWTHYGNRCRVEGHHLFSAPIPDDFVLSPENWLGETPNAGLAVLKEDGVTLIQTQPFARCTPGKAGTSRYVWPEISIYGDGIIGAHGGSGMSAIGGTIRLGELVPGGVIRHAIKINVYAAKYLYYDEETRGKRWPAPVSDGYAADIYGTRGNPVKACRMGALLAIPAFMDLAEYDFETGPDGPAMILARALQSYGAYIVDDTYWDVVAIATEYSPEGRVLDEFEEKWGYSLESPKDSPFGRDMKKIITSLHVVTNNSEHSIGGGSVRDLNNRLAPIACDFGTPGSGRKCPGDGRDIAPATGVKISEAYLSLRVNDRHQLRAKVDPKGASIRHILWQSADTSIAVVTSTGLVVARSEGRTQVTAYNHDMRLRDVCMVYVDDPEEDKEPKDEVFSKSIGDLYEGGIIFHLWKDRNGNEHGLVASLTDVSDKPVKWGALKETSSQSLEDGESNTRIILQELGSQSAAGLCDGFTYEGFDDWYLPSIKELNLLWKQQEIINKILDEDGNRETHGLRYGGYWSSTDATETEAWMEFTGNDFFGYYRKDLKNHVRAIRKF